MPLRYLFIGLMAVSLSFGLHAEDCESEHEQSECETPCENPCENPCVKPKKTCCPHKCGSHDCHHGDGGRGRHDDHGYHPDFHPYDYHGHSSGQHYQVGGGHHRGQSGYNRGSRRDYPGYYHYDRFGDHAHPDADLYRSKHGSWSKSQQGDVHYWESDNYHEFHGDHHNRYSCDKCKPEENGDKHENNHVNGSSCNKCKPCHKPCQHSCHKQRKPCKHDYHSHDYRTGHRVPLKGGSWPTHWPGQPKHLHGPQQHQNHYHGYPQPAPHGDHRGYHHQGPGRYRSDVLPSEYGVPGYNQPIEVRHGGHSVYVNVDRDEMPAVHPIQRSKDLMQSFIEIRKEHPNERLFALVNGQSIDGIVGMEPVGDGTLMLVTMERYGRLEQRVVPVEDIEDFGLRSRAGAGRGLQIPKGW